MINMANAAQHSIDIGNPSFKAWIGCGDSYQDGCTPEVLRNQASDPFWIALLNAIHRGVAVRIIYANCDIPPVGKGLIVPLPFVQLTGGQVKYYKGTSYYHLKYMAADNSTAYVSSVNLSHSSMVDDREAGIVFTAPTGQAFINYWGEVFEYDWQNGGVPAINNTYTASEMATITDTSYIVPPPMPKINDSCAYIPPEPVVISGVMDITTYTMPDFAYETFMGFMNQTKKSIYVYMYVINDWNECNKLIDMHKSGIDVNVMISSELVGSYPISPECSKALYDANVPLRMSGTCYAFYHQKYWIIDGETVFVSSGNFDAPDLPPPGHQSSDVVDHSSSSSTFPVNGVGANRGHTVVVKGSSALVEVFMDVWSGDYAHGKDYYPGYPMRLHARKSRTRK
eukprot:c26868_g1_i1.p2 GENE.c26868_g1_i1~~c26868_g1_i1.p2  ORF type:complete len:466 (+),score=104.12 c26868_g1_i1:210-1400(+)